MMDSVVENVGLNKVKFSSIDGVARWEQIRNEAKWKSCSPNEVEETFKNRFGTGGLVKREKLRRSSDGGKILMFVEYGDNFSVTSFDNKALNIHYTSDEFGGKSKSMVFEGTVRITESPVGDGGYVAIWPEKTGRDLKKETIYVFSRAPKDK